MEGLKDAAARAVKVDLALRAVADAEDLAGRRRRVEAEYERIAVRVGQKPAQVRKAYERSDAVPELRAELRKRKAMEWLLRTVEVVDGEGRTIERSLLLPDEELSDVAAEADAHASGDAADDDIEDRRVTNYPELLHPHGGRADQPRRGAGLRPVLQAAQGEHHLPGHARSTTRSPT